MNIPTGFHFRLILEGHDGKELSDSSFQSISGLEVFFLSYFDDSSAEQTKDDRTSDNKRFSPLQLTRGVRDISHSPLSKWFFKCMNEKEIVALPKARIELLDEEHKPFLVWIVTNLKPVSWRLGELNASKNELLFETFELSYDSLKFHSK